MQSDAVKRRITMVLVDSVTPDYVWAHQNTSSLCKLALWTWWDNSHIAAACLSDFKVWRQFQRSGVAACIVYQATHGLCMDILHEEMNWVKSMEFGSMCLPLTRRKHMGWSTTCSEKYVLTNDMARTLLSKVYRYGFKATVGCMIGNNACCRTWN